MKLKQVILSSVLLISISSTFAQDENIKDGLKSVTSSSLINKSVSVSAEEVSPMRQTVLKDLASSYGVSAGLYWKMQKIKNEELSGLETRLNKFDFSKLAISPGVLPPVIIEGTANYAQNSDDEVRLSDKTIKIDKPAKFYSTYPTWRNYLIFDISAPEEIPQAILPKTPGEAKIWDYWVEKGFEQGVIQAKANFQNAMDTMDKDYNGMLKFHQLFAQGQITDTVVSAMNLGVTGGGREMRINDQVFRIEDHSSLVSDESKWKTTYPITNKDNKGNYK